MKWADAKSVRSIRAALARLRRKSPTAPAKQKQRSANASAKIADVDVIGIYGAFMKRHPSLPTRIQDTSILPFPKERVLHAILVELARGHTEHLSAALKLGARLLAQYQPGVGSAPLIDLAELPDPKDIKALPAEAMRVASAETEAGRQRYLDFDKLVKADLVRIEAKIAAAEAIAKEATEP